MTTIFKNGSAWIAVKDAATNRRMVEILLAVA